MFFDWQDFGWLQIKNKYTDMYLTILFLQICWGNNHYFLESSRQFILRYISLESYIESKLREDFLALKIVSLRDINENFFLEWLKWLCKIINLKFRLANVGKIKAINYAGDNSRTSRPPQLNSSMRNAYINIKHAYFALIPEPLHHYIAISGEFRMPTW